MSRSDADKPELRGRRVTVMGLGTFGGGLGAVRFLRDRGARVTVTDLRSEEDLSESLAALDSLGPVTLHLGGHRDDDFRRSDLIVVNPAVPPESRYLEIARSAGVPLTSEINLFWQHNRGRVVAVTGSNGKSTTAALTHAILEAGGRRCRLGGNIGQSLLPVVDEITSDDWIVLELSSFQLETLAPLRPAPEIAVVTGFAPNHLDRHKTLGAYRRTKQNLMRWQEPGQCAVLNGDDPDVVQWTGPARRLLFGLSDQGEPGAFQRDSRSVLRLNGQDETLPLQEWLKLPGPHNLRNALAAACVARLAGVEPAAIRAGVERFTGLPHRLQLVAEQAGRRFYNDSLATTPESTIAALEAFSRPVVLLAGGSDKQVDLGELAATIGRRAKAVALMGETGPALHRLLEGEPSAVNHRVCRSLADAFGWAIEQSDPGDVVLLSPGCASYDWFENFADRGEQFIQRVRHWCRRGAG